jgi:membrane protease YdiL (CAAX protease family)
MEFANNLFNKVAYYPQQLVRPLNNEDFDNATSSEKTWYDRAVAQATLGVRAEIFILPVSFAIWASMVFWTDHLRGLYATTSMFPSVNERSLTIFYLCIGKPIVEELAVRGGAQTVLKHSVHRFLGDTENAERHAQIAAVFLSAFIFGGMHGRPAQAVATLFCGLSWGYLKERTKGSLWAPMAAHITHNSVIAGIQLIALGKIIS